MILTTDAYSYVTVGLSYSDERLHLQSIYILKAE